MKCHRTIGQSVLVPASFNPDGTPSQWSWEQPPPRDCIGSECAVWIRGPFGEEHTGFCSERSPATGKWIAPSWPDPAKKAAP